MSQSASADGANADGQFSISSRRLEDGILVALSGDVDLASASLAEAELQRAEHSENLVVLDLSEVSFMDSTGLRMMISADQRLRARGATLRLIHVPHQIGRLLELVGIVDHLEIADRLDEKRPAMDGAGPVE